MEVKVIQQTKNALNKGSKTHIFECGSLTHEIIEYKDYASLLNIYSHKHNGNYDDGYVIGIPELFEENENVSSGEVLFLKMDRGGSGTEYILCKDCKVYITTKGQTIDIISI